MNLEELKESIDIQLKSNKILHSYMFYGENIEKYYDEVLLFLYKIATKSEYIEQLDEKEKDKAQNLITQIKANTVEEFKQIDGKEAKVADIRKVFSTIYEKPLIISKRIYVIYNFEYLNVNSQNALLKILEEPPSYVTIVLFSKTLNNILDTIKSRCRKTYLAEEETEIINSVENIENEEILKILEDANILSQTLYYEKYSKKIDKTNIEEVLKIIELLIYDKIYMYNEVYKVVVEIKKKIKMNSNFEMVKDKLIFEIWETIRKKGK